VLADLRAEGIEHFAMLTGDREASARTVAGELGIADVEADLLPIDKAAWIERKSAEGRRVAMVGDGVNDAPALAAADIGIAMGARGSAASSETADIVLLVDHLDRLAQAVAVAQRARTIALQSVVAGLGLSIAAMLVAAAGYLQPVQGALTQEAIDVAVILNALRALRPPKPL
jgi:P-type E1-E2 ATPase